MAKILSFEKAFQAARSKNMVEQMIGQMEAMYGSAHENIQKYEDLLRKDIRAGIRELPRFIDQARKINKIPDSLAGGPNPDWTVPLLNIIGDVYPYLERESRREALDLCMNYLDGIRTDQAQNHVEGIDEPWLAGDIVITRGLYWPGFQRYCMMLEKSKTWKEMHEVLPQVGSAFWMAFAVLRKEYASDEVRKNFYRNFPTLIDRTQDAIAGLTSDHSESESVREGTTVDHNIQQRLFKYDYTLGSSLLTKIKERKWIAIPDRGQFNYRMQNYEREEVIDQEALLNELRSMRRRYDNMDEVLKLYAKYSNNKIICQAIHQVLSE